MTDFIEQELLADSPVFSGGAPVANGEHTLAAIGAACADETAEAVKAARTTGMTRI